MHFDPAARVVHLKTKPWNSKDFLVPQEVFSVPGMLWKEEKRMLYYLTLRDYTGDGVIADMGSFLGGSTICFATALKRRSFDKPLIHSYDLFKVEPPEQSVQQRFFTENLPAGSSTREIFDNNLRDYLNVVTVHEGDVLGFASIGEPIELLFIDIAKSYKVMDHLLLNFFTALIPAKSLIIMQDYLSPQTGPWHHVVMEKLSGYCEYIFDLSAASAVFLLRQKIPLEILEQSRWMTIPMEEKLLLMEKAIEKLDTPEKKAFLISNREILLQGKDSYWGMQYHNL
jgi:hypothetical protein